MSKILHSVTFKTPTGRTWLIDTYITKETAAFWREQRVEVYETINTIPKWYVDMGGNVRLWCFVQDIFHFKNPWKD